MTFEDKMNILEFDQVLRNCVIVLVSESLLMKQKVVHYSRE